MQRIRHELRKQGVNVDAFEPQMKEPEPSEHPWAHHLAWFNAQQTALDESEDNEVEDERDAKRQRCASVPEQPPAVETSVWPSDNANRDYEKMPLQAGAVRHKQEAEADPPSIAPPRGPAAQTRAA